MAAARGRLVFVTVSLLAVSVDGGRVRLGVFGGGDVFSEKYSFYHTSAALAEEASSLAASCAAISLSAETDGDASLQVARLAAIGKDGGDQRREQKVLMVFGEHARELISPEVGLAWLRRLCDNTSEQLQLRQDTSYTMVLNANPQGRAMVESGAFCTRTNENGVDLNRNYGFHWQAEHATDDETGVGSKQGKEIEAFSSGSRAFSEPETRIVARLINETRPDIFLDVHSGTKGLFMPNDWTTDPIPNEADRQHMMSVLEEVSSSDCPECMVGACAETIGYLAPGSSADYAYSQGVAFSYIWEVYADAADVEADAADHRAFLARKSGSPFFLQRSTRAGMRRQRASLSPGNTASFGAELPSWAVDDEAGLAPMEQEAQQHCLLQFNPLTQAEYDSTVSRWTNAFVTLADAVRRVQGST